MNEEQLKQFIEIVDKKHYVHCSNYNAKLQDSKLDHNQKRKLLEFAEKYCKYYNENQKLNKRTQDDTVIENRVKLLNEYYYFLDDNGVNSVFSPQSKFRSTILEEFMYILLENLVQKYKQELAKKHELLKIGSARAYTNLYFSGGSFLEFVKSPQIGINQKDQDFAIYRPLTISIGESNAIETNLPIVAIENKTYIDKTMLEGSIATAEKIKSGNPYSLFLIVAENYDVDLSIDPVYSRIDQIYVLRKSKRNKNQRLKPIDYQVVKNIYNLIKEHLERDWSNVEKKMKDKGQII